MISKKVAVWMLAWLVMGSAVLAGPVNLREVPREAKWVLHLDVESLMASKLGDVVREVAAFPDLKPKLAALDAMLSVDPLRDFKSVTLCGNKADDQQAAVYIRGVFAREKLETVIRAADQYQEIRHAAYVVHSWVDKGKRTYGCFVRDDLVVMSANGEVVEAVLDTIAGNHDNLAGDAVFSDWDVEKNDFVFVAMARGLDQLDGVHPKAAVLKRIRDAQLRVGETDTNLVGHVNVRADSEESAQQIRQTVMGFQSLLLLNAEEQPLLAKVAETLTIETEGDAVTMSVSCASETINELLRKKIEEDRANKERAPDEAKAPTEREAEEKAVF